MNLAFTALLRSRRAKQAAGQLASPHKKVGQCVTVESRDERLERLVKNVGQIAGASNHALVAGPKAFDWLERAFHMPDHFADDNVLGILCQRETPSLAAICPGNTALRPPG